MKFNREQGAHFFQRSKEILAHNGVTDADQISELVDILQYHEWRYYVLSEPLLSDKEYDQLYQNLVLAEGQNPNSVRPDSPTQRVSSDLADGFNSVEHLVPMLSLDNTYNAEDLQNFDKQIRKLCGLSEEDQLEYTVEPKYDGGSVAVIYEDNYLSRAATRGNGVKGDDITANIRTIKSMPLAIDLKKHGIYKAEFRGEALIRLDHFKQMNEQREVDGVSVFANPRNAATGGLRMKDPREAAQRNLDLFLYQMGYAINADGGDELKQFKTHSEIIQFMSTIGLKVPKEAFTVCNNINEVIKSCEDWSSRRNDYPYEIDGLVIKVNRLDYQDICGYTSHHPRWAAAYKFAAKQATSRLLDVEYQVGKVGSITPVAKVEPVPLAGVTISSISLHNEEFILSKDLRLGDVVLLERAGDVIPYIVKAMDDLRTGDEQIISYPTACPSCSTALIKVEGEAAWRCPNASHCPDQIRQRLIFHVSKDAMDIDGMGPSYINKFMELGWVNTVADIYSINYNRVAELEGFGQRSAEKLEKAIGEAKRQPISRVLYSLSIHHFGKRASKIVAGEIDHVFDLFNWTEEQFVALKDIGPVVARNVVEWMAEEENRILLRSMESRGVNMVQTDADKPEELNAEGVLFGKTILFTGTLQELSRKEAKDLAKNAGAKNISAVSGNLNILVVGEKAGSKLKKAEDLGSVTIWTEQDFIEKISENY